MESRTEICSEILRQFRGRWNVDEVRQMALDQYVSVGDKDTFCQWLETKTRKLGSIKGVYSSKFGIYKRQDESKKPKTLYNDKDYSWLKYYGDDRSEAFKKIINEILEIIHYADTGQFEQIDNLHLPQFVRWKRLGKFFSTHTKRKTKDRNDLSLQVNIHRTKMKLHSWSM